MLTVDLLSYRTVAGLEPSTPSQLIGQPLRLLIAELFLLLTNADADVIALPERSHRRSPEQPLRFMAFIHPGRCVAVPATVRPAGTSTDGDA
jgi:hypothetical protein